MTSPFVSQAIELVAQVIGPKERLPVSVPASYPDYVFGAAARYMNSYAKDREPLGDISVWLSSRSPQEVLASLSEKLEPNWTIKWFSQINIHTDGLHEYLLTLTNGDEEISVLLYHDPSGQRQHPYTEWNSFHLDIDSLGYVVDHQLLSHSFVANPVFQGWSFQSALLKKEYSFVGMEPSPEFRQQMATQGWKRVASGANMSTPPSVIPVKRQQEFNLQVWSLISKCLENLPRGEDPPGYIFGGAVRDRLWWDENSQRDFLPQDIDLFFQVDPRSEVDHSFLFLQELQQKLPPEWEFWLEGRSESYGGTYVTETYCLRHRQTGAQIPLDVVVSTIRQQPSFRQEDLDINCLAYHPDDDFFLYSKAVKKTTTVEQLQEAIQRKEFQVVTPLSKKRQAKVEKLIAQGWKDVTMGTQVSEQVQSDFNHQAWGLVTRCLRNACPQVGNHPIRGYLFGGAVRDRIVWSRTGTQFLPRDLDLFFSFDHYATVDYSVAFVKQMEANLPSGWVCKKVQEAEYEGGFYTDTYVLTDTQTGASLPMDVVFGFARAQYPSEGQEDLDVNCLAYHPDRDYFVFSERVKSSISDILASCRNKTFSVLTELTEKRKEKVKKLLARGWKQVGGPAIEFKREANQWYRFGSDNTQTPPAEDNQKVSPTSADQNQSASKSQEFVMSNSFMDHVKSDLSQGTFRVAAKTIPKTARTALLAFLKAKKAPKHWIVTAKEVMATDYGLAMIQQGLAWSFRYFPALREDARAQALANEWAIDSIAMVGNEVVNEAMAFLAPIVAQVMELPMPEKVRVEPRTESRVEPMIKGVPDLLKEEVKDAKRAVA